MIEELKPQFETVMIIDDNTIDLYISSRLITKNNFGKKVLEHPNAMEALHYLKENQDNKTMLPQVIFVDIYMPMMSGFQFLEAYEELPLDLKNNCRIYILSSTIDDDDISRARRDKNVISFQVKPITREFLDRIKGD